MYETAVAHSFGKPTIIIVENDGDTTLPFDLSSDRAIFYDNSIEGTGNLKNDLESKIKHIEETSVYDNPVLRVMKQAATLERMGEKDDIQSQMYRMLIEIQDKFYLNDKIIKTQQLNEINNIRRGVIRIYSINEIDTDIENIIFKLLSGSPYKIKNIRKLDDNNLKISIQANNTSLEMFSEDLRIIERKISKVLPDVKVRIQIIN